MQGLRPSYQRANWRTSKEAVLHLTRVPDSSQDSISQPLEKSTYSDSAARNKQQIQLTLLPPDALEAALIAFGVDN